MTREGNARVERSSAGINASRRRNPAFRLKGGGLQVGVRATAAWYISSSWFEQRRQRLAVEGGSTPAREAKDAEECVGKEGEEEKKEWAGRNEGRVWT